MSAHYVKNVDKQSGVLNQHTDQYRESLGQWQQEERNMKNRRRQNFNRAGFSSFFCCLAVVCFSLVLFSLPSLAAPLDKPTVKNGENFEHSLRHGRLERTYQVHVPRSVTPNRSAPVVIVFHGGGGTPADIQLASGMNHKADSSGFIAVYPRAVAPKNKWNLGPRENNARDASFADDIGFIRKMLDALQDNYNIDRDRVYVTGISNGGAMAYRVACELSDRIAAAAPVATTMILKACHPSKPVPIMHFHGKQDKMISFAGGHSDVSVPVRIRLMDDLMPVEEVVSSWVANNACELKSYVTFQRGNVECRTHHSCRQGAEVTLCSVETGGHTWPGGRRESDALWYRRIVGEVTEDISATDEMWEFFLKHPRE